VPTIMLYIKMPRVRDNALYQNATCQW